MFLIIMFSSLLFGAQQDDSDLISLDLKGMDIRDVLKILSQKSGLNIVADSEVSATITLYLKDVSIMDAINIMVSTNKLAYEQAGSLIRIMNEEDYKKSHGKSFDDPTKTEVIKLNYVSASEVEKALAQMKSGIGKVISEDASNTIVIIDSPENIKRMKEVISGMDMRLVTEVFSLDYAKAELLNDKLEQMLSKNAGSLKFDERTNKLVVKDTQQKIEDIKKVVDAFDEKTREVVIDANIIQVTLADKYSYGIDWSDIAKLGDVKLTADTNLSSGLSNVTPNTLTIATVGGNYKEVISLLKTFGETNVLSRPRITVADKQEAKILVGSKEVYVSSDVTTTSGGTYHTTDNIQFVDVGVRLGVVPQINKMGFVTLKIKPEVSNADATKTVILKNPDGSTRTVVPYVTTSEAETTVLVKDNTTIIIGGLMKDTLVNNKQKVPFLGDIPLVGKLFSTTGKSKEKTELVVFLTPHIIEGDNVTEETKKCMADWEKKAGEIKIEEPKDPEIDLSKMFPEKKEGLKAEMPDKKIEKTEKKMAPLFKKEEPKLKTADKKKTVKKGDEPRRKWAPLLGQSARKEDKSIKEAGMPGKPQTGKEAPYQEYYFEISRAINDLAREDKDAGGINGDVELQFTLDKEGFLIRGPVVLNNPDLRLVRSAVKAVKKAAPFIRFPKTLNKKQAEFNVVIKYE